MKKYRVEAFIIPKNIKNLNDSNQIDDEKLAKKLKDKSITGSEETGELNLSRGSESENDHHNISEFSGLFFEIDEHIYDEIIIPARREKENEEKKESNIEYSKAFFKIEEPIYDEPFIGNLTKIPLKNSNNGYDVPQSRWTLAKSKFPPYGIVAPKLPKRSSSLKSIIEDNETFESTLQEICCHGRKNGCLLTSERPEDISEEIFKENWMQRLDSLRKLETLLKDKEVALQSRERLLFKKEKELRILERLVKDKMKQAELYAKRCKKTSSCESISNNDRNIESRSSGGSKDHAKVDDAITLSKTDLKSIVEKKNDKIFQNPVHSRSSLFADRLSSRVGSTRSRSKPRQKIRYDDLDSTLSADIGDSSFIVTSRKFDPITFKKPAAFSRSASERRPRVDQQMSTLKLNSLIEKDEHILDSINIVEEKTIKKISDNIMATQNEETKFLNYGPIDKSISHLNLEITQKPIKMKNNKSKERPVSWSENADDWLIKKRQAYNLATQKVMSEQIQDKENSVLQRNNKSIKIPKKKENNHKKFSIFR